jgi:glutamate decarboxylase
MESLRDTALHLSSNIAAMGPFEVVSDGSAIPVLAFKVKDPSKFTVFHVSDQLRTGGWQVPAYTMPENATDVAVLRIVVREGFGMDLADMLLEAIGKAVDHLEQYPPLHPAPEPGFSHT